MLLEVPITGEPFGRRFQPKRVSGWQWKCYGSVRHYQEALLER